MQRDLPHRSPISGVVLAVLGVVVFVIVLIGVLVIGGFWLDHDTGFLRRVAVDATAGGTTTKIVLELERLDPPPVITTPAP